MQWKLDDLPLFVAVIENRGVTAAAKSLQLSKSAVSKSLIRLEEMLGTRLVERNSRNLRLTSEGMEFYQHAMQILEQVNEARVTVSGWGKEPTGALVVALPMAFCREFVAPILGGFIRQYPGIDLELLVTSHPVDIIRENIDLAVVVGALPDSDLVVRPLIQSGLVWVASPDYLERHRVEGSPVELQRHVLICEKRYGLRRLPARSEGQRLTLDLASGTCHVNDPLAVREAVLGGAGVSLLPLQYCKRHLESGELVQVLHSLVVDATSSQLSAIYPGRRMLSRRVRVFLEFLQQICAKI